MGIHILLSFPLGVQVKISPEALEERVAIYPPPSQAGLEGRGCDPHRTSSLLSLAPSPLLRVSVSPQTFAALALFLLSVYSAACHRDTFLEHPDCRHATPGSDVFLPGIVCGSIET